MKYPIRHRPCGEILAYYVGEVGAWEANSKDIELLDGTTPIPCSLVEFKCEKCNESVTSINKLWRDFSDKKGAEAP